LSLLFELCIFCHTNPLFNSLFDSLQFSKDFVAKHIVTNSVQLEKCLIFCKNEIFQNNEDEEEEKTSLTYSELTKQMEIKFEIEKQSFMTYEKHEQYLKNELLLSLEQSTKLQAQLKENGTKVLYLLLNPFRDRFLFLPNILFNRIKNETLPHIFKKYSINPSKKISRQKNKVIKKIEEEQEEKKEPSQPKQNKNIKFSLNPTAQTYCFNFTDPETNKQYHIDFQRLIMKSQSQESFLIRRAMIGPGALQWHYSSIPKDDGTKKFKPFSSNISAKLEIQYKILFQKEPFYKFATRHNVPLCTFVFFWMVVLGLTYSFPNLIWVFTLSLLFLFFFEWINFYFISNHYQFLNDLKNIQNLTKRKHEPEKIANFFYLHVLEEFMRKISQSKFYHYSFALGGSFMSRQIVLCFPFPFQTKYEKSRFIQ
jgi:hypothetical protein